MEVIQLPPLPQRSLTKRQKRAVNLAISARMASTGVVFPSASTKRMAPPPPQVVALRGRKPRNRNRKQPSSVVYSPMSLQNPLVPQALGVSTSSKTQMVKQRMDVLRGQKITPEGVRFLKCAFSAADFDGSGVYGVPDDFSGRSTAIKHRAVNTTSFAASTDVYYFIPPTPGVAYWFLNKTAGAPIVSTDVWQPVPYSDYVSLFGSPALSLGNQTVQKFRYVSQHFEICPTTNSNTWTGSIQSFKLPVQASLGVEVGLDPNRLGLSGLVGVNANDADMYSGPFNLGTYVGAYNKGSTDWKFSDVWKNQNNLPESIQTGDFTQLNGAGFALVTGFDNNFESIIVKVSGIGTNASNSALLRSWACIEYQFTPGTVMYEMQNLKSLEDKLAIQLYRRITTELPTAVSYLDNANFWMRVLGIIKQISGGLSFVPGPYGLAASGVNTLAGALEQIVI